MLTIHNRSFFTYYILRISHQLNITDTDRKYLRISLLWFCFFIRLLMQSIHKVIHKKPRKVWQNSLKVQRGIPFDSFPPPWGLWYFYHHINLSSEHSRMRRGGVQTQAVVTWTVGGKRKLRRGERGASLSCISLVTRCQNSTKIKACTPGSACVCAWVRERHRDRERTREWHWSLWGCRAHCSNEQLPPGQEREMEQVKLTKK